jgi:dihydroneopterin aldolase
MSDLISIKGIKGFGFHGVFDFEKRDGQNFSVDIEVEIDLTKARVMPSSIKLVHFCTTYIFQD